MPTVTNPFKVFTPEDLDTKQTMDLFFEVPYLKNIRDPGNTLLKGPRGSGKSMLFRYLKPDCQMAASSSSVRELEFFAVLISIKRAADLTELRRLQDYSARTMIGEHALATYVGARLFEAVIEVAEGACDQRDMAAEESLREQVLDLMAKAGGRLPGRHQLHGGGVALNACKSLCEDAYSYVNHFARRLAFGTSGTYDGPLCDYLTFLYPIINEVRRLPFMPSSQRMYLMFDDADHLSDEQTRVLNSWLIARTQGAVSIKVATQLHKTLGTVTGALARAPHDFQLIDMADLYTTKRGPTYANSVRGIVQKRLRAAGIDVELEEFFPSSIEQDAAIRRIGEEIRARWPQEGRGNRPADDVLRYARPDYMKSLAGTAKSASTFFYAGFDELVHISSGQVRYFLEPAAKMFDDQRSRNGDDKAVLSIDQGIQSKVLREEADALMFGEFDDLKRSSIRTTEGASIDDLRNLISFLGGLFRMKLLSDDAERRVFSIAVTRGAQDDVADVLNRGVELGYFHVAPLGNKEGTGRVRRYVLTRRLAPHFNLDPSSFAGYQFITNDNLRRAIADPHGLLQEVRRRGTGWVADEGQLKLF